MEKADSLVCTRLTSLTNNLSASSAFKCSKGDAVILLTTHKCGFPRIPRDTVPRIGHFRLYMAFSISVSLMATAAGAASMPGTVLHVCFQLIQILSVALTNKTSGH